MFFVKCKIEVRLDTCQTLISIKSGHRSKHKVVLALQEQKKNQGMKLNKDELIFTRKLNL